MHKGPRGVLSDLALGAELCWRQLSGAGSVRGVCNVGGSGVFSAQADG